MDKRRIALIPMLKSTEVQGIGWRVSYRDPVTKTPRRYRFGIRERAREEVAVAAYHRRLGQHRNRETPKPRPAAKTINPKTIDRASSVKAVTPHGSGTGLRRAARERLVHSGE